VEIIYTDKDGNTVKFTEEMAIAAITERDELRVSLSDWSDRSTRHYGKLITVREQVHEFFNSRFDPDTDTAIECEIDDVNELLRNIGAEELKKLWTVIGTINFTISNISASNEDEANDYAMNELSVEVGGDADLDDWSVDISSTEQQ
jgi:hypothetical protein